MLLQDWLNANPDFYWGLVFAGDRLRLMRDNASLTRPAWIEADLGAIFRDEIKDLDQAIAAFNQALDHNPDHLKAFEAIDRLLTQKKDWKELERNYRKMLKRAMEQKLDDKLVITLAKGLGEINRSRLKKYDEAVKAYKIALGRQPDDLQRAKGLFR